MTSGANATAIKPDVMDAGPNELHTSQARRTAKGEMMVEAVVRCPYCVSDSEFLRMVALADGAFECVHCSHMTIPSEDFKCLCSKCVEMRSLDVRPCG